MKKINGLAAIACALSLYTNTAFANAMYLNTDDGTKSIVYYYDAAGNRIQRGYDTNKAKQKSPDNGNGNNITKVTQNAGNRNIYTIELMPSVELSDCHFGIYDLSGRLYGYKSLNKHKTKLNIENFRSGCYIIKIETKEGSYSVKITK